MSFTDWVMQTSRSVVESYHDCPRYRFNNYHLGGKGLVPKSKSIPLVTGGNVHKGIEHILNRARINEEPNIDVAVGLAVEDYEKEVQDRGFRGKGVEIDRQQEFTYFEQRALIEALIRAWFIAEYPLLIQRYKILAVERDIEPLPLANGVEFMAKVDCELQEIASGDYHNYSLKTAKQWNERSENSYKGDLQGLTEIWAVEEDNKRANRLLSQIGEIVDNVELYRSRTELLANLTNIGKFARTKIRDKKVMGVRFCILIKGPRMLPPSQREDPNALYVTYNPFIRGYKNITPTSVNYAHSWRYPNHENASGFGTLGKGWEPFNVWEQQDMDIKSWVAYLAGGACQPECGDVVKNHVVTPPEYFRDDEEIEEAIREVKLQEERIKIGLDEIAKHEDVPEIVEHLMARYFPHYKKHCEFLYGEVCQYKDLCWNPVVKANPMELYEIRESHHSTERS